MFIACLLQIEKCEKQRWLRSAYLRQKLRRLNYITKICLDSQNWEETKYHVSRSRVITLIKLWRANRRSATLLWFKGSCTQVLCGWLPTKSFPSRLKVQPQMRSKSPKLATTSVVLRHELFDSLCNMPWSPQVVPSIITLDASHCKSTIFTECSRTGGKIWKMRPYWNMLHNHAQPVSSKSNWKGLGSRPIGKGKLALHYEARLITRLCMGDYGRFRRGC
jgi:hypothetical protein